MIARKDDPIWTKISAFGTPYPPFDYNSGMWVEEIDREEAEALGVIKPSTVVQPQDRGFNDDVSGAMPVDPDSKLGKALLDGMAESTNLKDGRLTMKPAKRTYRPASSIKQAEEIARENDLADAVVYKGLDVSVANQINAAMVDAFNKFPQLRQGFQFVGSAQAQNRIAKRLYTETLRKKFPDMSEGYLKRMVNRGIRPVGPNTWAHSADKIHTQYDGVQGIAINEKYGSKKGIAEFHAGLRRCVDSKYHPTGCDTVRSVVDHEIGHQVDALVGAAKDPAIKKMFADAVGRGYRDTQNSLSGYGAKNIAEFIAESWAEYHNNPAKRRLATEVVERILTMKGIQ
jgi:hypothetical protein